MTPDPALQTTPGITSDGTGPAPQADPPALMEPGPAAIRPNSGPGRVYPWLLILSTGIAALFCVMYITKPVIQTISPPSVLSNSPVRAVLGVPKPPVRPSAKPTPDVTVTTDGKSARTDLMPNGDRLPGEPAASPATDKHAAATSRPAPPSLPSGSPYEETNLKIQHILNAEGPGGFLARLDLDVPVLYQSRNLRWTPDDVTEARELVGRLISYQEKTKLLRAEGGDLLATWNRLMDRSLPVKELRADSPSLPTNQEDAADSAHPAVLLNTESIKIQPAGK